MDLEVLDDRNMPLTFDEEPNPLITQVYNIRQ